MQKFNIVERSDKNKKLESIGFSFHAWDNYWRESNCYEFTKKQANVIERATNELHQMCLEAVSYVIKKNLLSKMAIPEQYHAKIKDSLKEPGLYGRFDLWYNGIDSPKMLEYNADTPTSLIEAGMAQLKWQQEVYPQYSQFNNIHKKLVERWRTLGYKKVYFTCISNNEEDLICLNYIMSTAIEAGVDCDIIFIENIKYNHDTKYFLDDKEEAITHIFKLYPYEWLMEEEFGEYLIDSPTMFIEPLWKSLLSNKAILPILYEMFPNSEYLLPAYFEKDKLTHYCKKPFFSREGANIEIYAENTIIQPGPYGQEGYIYQQYLQLPHYNGFYPVIGSWVIGDEAAGIAVREDAKVITTNMSYFVPHYVK